MGLTLDAAMESVEELFATRYQEGLTPGLVYGVVRDGELVHSAGLGTTHAAGSRVPDADSVFRIASMSKSFTAAALLLLRDRGLVDLDEAVAQYVPELVDQPPHSPHSPAVTLRLLLSMSAGLLTDDPWGDRQEALPYADFGTFLDGGFTVGCEPGTAFEYSNLGYALLGRVIENVVGGAEPEGANRRFIESELLAPLGMTSTRFDATEVGSALVPGHVLRSTGWQELAPTAPGAFSAMGGLHSSLTDLARWVGGFLSAFRPGRDASPLSKASRREMQQMHRFNTVTGTLSARGADAGIGAVALGYGYGLMVEHDAALGHFVHHSGGYPGYGSRMVWHPATGLGVVTMSNGTYAGAYEQALTATRLLVRAAGRPASAPSLPATRDAVAYATDRVASFDPVTTGEPFADPQRFADNVELDVPDEERRGALQQARKVAGEPQPVADPAPLWSRAMAHAGWSVPAERGRYDLELLLSPEETPRLQQLLVRPVADVPAEVLDRAHAALAADTPETRIMTAFGTPELLPRAVASDGTGTAELLVAAGPTWWKVVLTPEAVTLEAHPTSAYPRLAALAEVLRAA